MTMYSLAEIYFHLIGICCLQLRVAEFTSGVETSVNICWTAQGQHSSAWVLFTLLPVLVH